ncbi:ferredoxin [Bacillus sp. ISL-75]|jgi:ferredoxin|nr:ferredoxin [Bacillus sp. ISL-75]
MGDTLLYFNDTLNRDDSTLIDCGHGAASPEIFDYNDKGMAFVLLDENEGTACIIPCWDNDRFIIR